MRKKKNLSCLNCWNPGIQILGKLLPVYFFSCQGEREYNTELYHRHYVGRLAVRMARKKFEKASVTVAVLGILHR